MLIPKQHQCITITIPAQTRISSWQGFCNNTPSDILLVFELDTLIHTKLYIYDTSQPDRVVTHLG